MALRCAGRYLIDRGFDDALIEAEIFGVNTVMCVLNGKHYVRAFQGMLIVSEVLEKMIWDAFWDRNEKEQYNNLLEEVNQFRQALQNKDKEKCGTLHTQLLVSSEQLRDHYLIFLSECSEKSEICRYLNTFLSIVGLIENLVASDREGDWNLHVETVESLIPVFQQFNCLNYLRYGSWYLEVMKRLQIDCPYLHEKFLEGLFVVSEKPASFNAVAPDMKLEQTIL